MSNIQPVNPAGFDDEVDSLEESEIIQLVGLKLGDEEYAIDVLKIQEIIRTVEITSVPRTDSFVLGVMNLRGKVIPVIDLRIRFILDKMDFDKETRIIVVRFETENIGFVVDEVTEVIRINKSMVDPTPPLVGSIGQEYILGICKYEDRLIILLDIDSVIGDGKTVESDLRRRFLGQPALESKGGVNYEEVAAAVESETIEADPEIEDAPTRDEAEEKENEADELDNIDALIAKELAKREQETDELNKKKQETESHDAGGDTDVEEILKDALSQSDQMVNGNEDYVVQGELDALIAMELSKREQETEELNRRKKEEAEKKNTKIEETVNLTREEAAEEVADSFRIDFDEDDSADGPSMEELLSAQETVEPFEKSIIEDINDILADEDEEFSEFEEDSENLVDEIDALLGDTESDESEEAFEKEELAAEDGSEAAEEGSVMAFAESKSPSAETPSGSKGIFIETDSLQDLKDLSRRIINGDAVDLGIDIKGEIGELLKLILDTKGKVDEIDPTILVSKDSMPVVVKSLEQVNETTEAATMNLMEAADKMTAFYSEFINDIEDFEDLVYKKDSKGLIKSIERIETDIDLAESLGFGILHALEFQDITEQKLMKVIKSVEEVGARIGGILGIIKARKSESDEIVEEASQDDIDSLLAEFGLG